MLRFGRIVFGRLFMHNKLWIAIFAAATLFAQQARAGAPEAAELFAGQDLHLAAGCMTIYKGPELADDEHILTFEDSFSITIGDNQLSSDRSFVRLSTVRADYLGTCRIDYNAQVYLEGNVSIRQGKGARTTDLNRVVVERGEALVARFLVNGEIFATADEHNIASVSELEDLEIYKNAAAAIKPVRHEPVIGAEALVPKLTAPAVEEVVEPKKPLKITDIFKIKLPGLPEKKRPVEEPVVEEVKEVKFEYPVNITGLWARPLEIEDTGMADGSRVSTVIGRLYLWQKRDEKGGLLELQADSAVIFRHDAESGPGQDMGSENVLPGELVRAIYLRGNIIMTEGARTIRADEIYYDFENRQALAVKAEMRTFDPQRGIPVYLRAVKLRQISESVFNADEITLTTSEFYIPQVGLDASRVLLTDTTGIDVRTGKKPEKSSYDAILYDAKVKLDQNTVFYWPRLRTNFERPDIPLRSAHVGHDSEFGTSVETRWHLSRLLGLKEPAGVDSELALDYFGKRGAGAGVDIDYRRDDYFGDVIGYVLRDRGTDDLGRSGTDYLGQQRRNVDSGEDIRGRFRFRHRHYLPYDWQATIETSYASDENFLEWFYRSEFDTAKEQETLLHLKRLKDNWAFSFLSKFRINDYETMTEELPSAEFHLKGASFWDHKLTFYSDTQISRFRDRLSSNILPTNSRAGDPQQFYTFASTRNEVDMPFMWNTVKVVPFIAGTYGYSDDEDGYEINLNGTKTARENQVWLGEAGIRAATMFWKENQFVKSRLWDINGIRHIVKPHVEAVFYHDNDETIEMRDVVNLGVSQRWQTRRGPEEYLRSFDWMRLDINATWLRDDADSAVGPPRSSSQTYTYGPAKFIWNDAAIPMLLRRDSSWFGIVRNSINTDYTWRVSDTTTVLSDMNYDIESGVVQQLNMGVSRYVYPDISYYIGSRYLRPVVIDIDSDNIHEEGSNSVVMAATYALNPKYTATIAQEYNFDFGKNVKSELTILRRYHRMYYGFTFSADESRKRKSIVFSIWPQGVRELALGRRKYIGLVGPVSED
ncbi:MAG: hypothetical protein DRP65_08755 [Planctomycetota bacterium]|nr:MAG: hypothetical protein DRP65_08755 [Planctomycetota bacterium]